MCEYKISDFSTDIFVILILCNITHLPHIKHNLKCRFIKFVNNATKSCNKKVKILAKMCINNTCSVTGCNMEASQRTEKTK